MKSVIVVVCFTVALLPLAVHCRSVLSRSRRSGISDQRLAELETLAGLKSLRHRLKGITFPVAFGLIDPNKIGKRKRSFESLEDLQRSAEDQRTDEGVDDIFTGLPATVGRMRRSSDLMHTR
ncbi:uncharacterized protein LOC135395341 [Ornithodoros turicata]|uniref:uncharacterized protein LOC135395341 n=1 Tax=Ornithodoros turicata TaxID=34597 RepID=UPI00313A2809